MTLNDIKYIMKDMKLLTDTELFYAGESLKAQPFSLVKASLFALWRAEVERRNIKRDPKKYAAGYGAAALAVVGITSL